MNNIKIKILKKEFVFIIIIFIFLIIYFFTILYHKKVKSYEDLVEKNTVILQTWIFNVHKARVKKTLINLDKCSFEGLGTLDDCFSNLSSVNQPLESFKNPFFINNKRYNVFVFSNNPKIIINENQNCSDLKINLNISSNLGKEQKIPIDWRGIILLQNLLFSNKLAKTNNKLILGFCDGKGRFKKISDKINF